MNLTLSDLWVLRLQRPWSSYLDTLHSFLGYRFGNFSSASFRKNVIPSTAAAEHGGICTPVTHTSHGCFVHTMHIKRAEWCPRFLVQFLETQKAPRSLRKGTAEAQNLLRSDIESVLFSPSLFLLNYSWLCSICFLLRCICFSPWIWVPVK